MNQEHPLNQERSQMDFIKKIQRERTEYSHASQVRMQAQSLLQLSQGIYTEPERFVYELLQNAVDAFTDTGEYALNVLVEVKDDRFIFMHNGKSFSEEDVIGISDVGNGTKALDSKKIGYKGIGFKSVFMPSVSRVIVISGGFCFEFNKEKAFSLMPQFPNEEKPLTIDDIPWQVIPIDASDLREDFEFVDYNVITIVDTPEASKIGEKIEGLFKDLQFLLFLRCHNVNITFVRNGKQELCVGKTQNECEDVNLSLATLTRNGESDSSWILFDDKVSVPDEIKSALERDFNTPDKLKGAKNVGVSFAVRIEDNKVIPIKNSAVFTFLPTSYRGLRQPFLINSNFITDAGRQQLHQESVWNRLIFGKIPELYLRFVAYFSRNYYNYTEVLPAMYPDNDSLTNAYRDALELALDTIEFVPNKNGNKLLTVGDVLIDDSEISKHVLSEVDFLSYANTIWETNFDSDNLVEDKKIASYAHDRVKVFGTKELEKLLLDESIVPKLDLKSDNKLIHYLFEYTKRLSEQSQSDKESFKDTLKHLPFLMNQDGVLKRPLDLFFPATFQEWSDEITEISVLNSAIYDDLKYREDIINWLRSLGLRDLSKTTFIMYLFDHPDYITKENALTIGRFMFEAWKKEGYLENVENAKKMMEIPFLAKDGLLHPISNLYLGSVYKPDDDLEAVCKKNELFISEDYLQANEQEDWTYFLKKCGAGYKIGIVEKIYDANDLNFDFIKNAATTFRNTPHKYSGYCGFENPIIHIKFRLSYLGFIDYKNPDYLKDRFILSKTLTLNKDIWNVVDRVYGIINYWGTPMEKGLNEVAPYSYTSQYHSFLEYIIANEQKFPTTLGTFEKPENIFINQPYIKELGGKYLPILDIESPVHQSWRGVIPFKKELCLCDLLTILEMVSKDEKEDKDAKRECVSRVYKEIIERELQMSDELATWAKSHTLLAKSDVFLPTKKLSYITVDGFQGDENKIFCEKVSQGNKDKLLQLLRTLGVKVITQQDITPNFDNPIEKDEIKNLLLKKVQYIAVLKNGTSENFEVRKANLVEKINSSKFFKCSAISLTYGKDDDVITKATFSRDECFYYTGNISPAGIEPLLAPLCNFLGLKNSCESELMVILLTQSSCDIYDFLKDKGYDVDNLATPVTVDDNYANGDKKLNDTIEHNPSGSNETMDGGVAGMMVNEDAVDGHVNAEDRSAKQKMIREAERKQFEQAIRDFLGGSFNLDQYNTKSEHIISCYRILKYLEGQGLQFAPKFDQKQFVNSDDYQQIKLQDGICVNPSSAKWGVWYIHPNVWRDIVINGNWACVCTGNGENDFILIKSEEDLEHIANTGESIIMKMSTSDNQNVFEVTNTVFPGVGNESMDIHLMIKLHDTPNELVNSLFDKAFASAQNDFTI